MSSKKRIPVWRMPGGTEQRLFLLLPWILLILIVWVGISLLYRQGGLLHRRELNSRIQSAVQERDELQRRAEWRRRELEYIRSDERAREEAVRSSLGLVQKGEILYIAPEPADAPESGDTELRGEHESEEQ